MRAVTDEGCIPHPLGGPPVLALPTHTGVIGSGGGRRSDIRLITLSATAMWTYSGAQVSTGWLLRL